MSRTDSDSWDLASSVGTTATMVAAARAIASREDDPLFDDIGALSAPDSRLATEYHPDGAATIGERRHVAEYLTEHGWQVSARNRPQVFAGYGHTFPDTDLLAPMRDSLAIIATRN